jgi:eukaryotic-like serine/threonine-protein kinase
MSRSPDTVIEIFNEALKRTSAERIEYLEAACTSDAGLRQRVENLLKAHERAGEFMEDPVTILRGGVAPKPPAGEGSGDRIGPYKLLQQIGEGGCGVVFMAEQEHPLRRRVALKVVKPGMDTKNVIARFEAERQALTLMEHPNIARVYDAGATDSGRPYFVMELVRGPRITDYCDQHSLTTSERLELFVQVCHAIQHAHHKGIIHRDIKPSNVLVTTAGDGTPLPKVIDFGIAKATTSQQLTDKTYFTAFEMLIGTPAYMSPEQAALTSVDVDTRTDIYSLGVLLYELLTGTPPFDVPELLKAGLDEMRRVILNKDPLRPSTRLKTMLEEDLTFTAQQRRMEPIRLIRSIRGDLDWIVMKALEKDPARRYVTANALATDVQRYLAHEPVSARPPTGLYKLAKLIQRNRLFTGSLVALGILLVSSLAIVSVLLAREKKARLQTEIEKRTAQTESLKSKQVTKFLSDTIAGVTPSLALGRDTTLLRAILNRAGQRISSELADQPEVEAELRLTFGVVYEKLGDYETAEGMIRRALELSRKSSQDTPQIATALHRLGLVLVYQNRPGDAAPMLESSLNLWKKLGLEEGQEAMLTLEAFAMLRWKQERLDEAESLMRRIYSLRQKLLPPDDFNTLSALNNLGSVLYSANRFPEAEQVFRQVIEADLRKSGTELPITAQAFYNLGNTLWRLGKANEAKDCLARAITMQRKLLSPNHPQFTASLMSLAEMQRAGGNLTEAESLYREVVFNGRTKPDDYNARIESALKKLVFTILAQGRTRDVDVLFAELLTPELSSTSKSAPILRLRVEFLARTGRWREAAADASRLLEWQPTAHESYHTLAPLLIADGQHDAYRKLCVEIVTRFANTTDIFVADRMAKDCLIHSAADVDYVAVSAMAELAVTKGQNSAARSFFQICKALAEYRQGRFATAAEWAKKVNDSNPLAGVEAGAVLAMAQHCLNQPEPARAQLARCAADFETKLPKLERGDLGEDWRDWIIARALLSEARGLIGGNEKTIPNER